MSRDWPWSELGLDRAATEREVKAAYAARLKQIDRNDPAAFGALRDAFAAARSDAIWADAANAPAQKPKTARPAMIDIADGHTDAAAPPPKPEPQPSKPAKRTDAAPDTDTRPPPENPPARPQAKPVPPAPKPRGVYVADIDPLFDTDPDKAHRVFMEKLQSAIKLWPWNVEALTQLLNTDMARDIDLRRTVERQFFQSISANLVQPEHGYPRRMAALVEAQFHWSTDGVGVLRRMGWNNNFQMIMHAHDLSRPATERARSRRKTEEKKHKYLPYKIASFGLLWLFSLQSQQPNAPLDFAILIVALGVLFYITRWLLVIGLAIARAVGFALHLDAPARRLAQWAMPATFQHLDQSAQFRSLAIFLLTIAVLSAVMIGQTV